MPPSIIRLAIFVLPLLAWCSANAQSFTNGSFEDYTGGDLSNHPAYTPLGSSGMGTVQNLAPDGWNLFNTPTGESPLVGSPDWVKGPALATHGTNLLSLEVFMDNTFDHQVAGGLSQQVTGLTTGQTYQVSFDAGRIVLEGGPANASSAGLDIFLDGTLFTSFSFTNDDLAFDLNAEVMSGSLNPYTFIFTATSATMDFGMRADSSVAAPGEFSGVALDHFTLTSVPEPGTASAMALSISVALLARRRRWQASSLA